METHFTENTVLDAGFSLLKKRFLREPHRHSEYASTFVTEDVLRRRVIVSEFLDTYFVTSNRTEVIQFLKAHRFLLPLLQQSHKKVEQFIPGASITLSVFHDPDSQCPPYLFGVIKSNLNLMEQFAIQEELRQSWWLDASDEAKGKFHLEL